MRGVRAALRHRCPGETVGGLYIYIHAYIHTHIHTYMHAYMHACMHA